MLLSMKELLQDFLLSKPSGARPQQHFCVVRVGPDFDGPFIYVADQSHHALKCYNKVLIGKLKQVYQNKDLEWQKMNEKTPKIDMVKFKLERAYFCRTQESKDPFSIDLAADSVSVFAQFPEKSKVPDFTMMKSMMDDPDIRHAVDLMCRTKAKASRQLSKLKPAQSTNKHEANPLKVNSSHIQDNLVLHNKSMAAEHAVALVGKSPENAPIPTEDPEPKMTRVCSNPECPNALLVEALMTQVSKLKTEKISLETELKNLKQVLAQKHTVEQHCEQLLGSDIGEKFRGTHLTGSHVPENHSFEESKKRSRSMRVDSTSQPKIKRSPLRKIQLSPDLGSERTHTRNERRMEITELLKRNLGIKPRRSSRVREGLYSPKKTQPPSPGNTLERQKSNQRHIEKQQLLQRLEVLKAEEEAVRKRSQQFQDARDEANSGLGKRNYQSLIEQASDLVKKARIEASKCKDIRYHDEPNSNNLTYHSVRRKPIDSDSPEYVDLERSSSKLRQLKADLSRDPSRERRRSTQDKHMVYSLDRKAARGTKSGLESEAIPLSDFRIIFPRAVNIHRYSLNPAELMHLDGKIRRGSDIRNYQVDWKWQARDEDSTQSKTRSPQRRDQPATKQTGSIFLPELIEI